MFLFYFVSLVAICCYEQAVGAAHHAAFKRRLFGKWAEESVAFPAPYIVSVNPLALTDAESRANPTDDVAAVADATEANAASGSDGNLRDDNDDGVNSNETKVAVASAEATNVIDSLSPASDVNTPTQTAAAVDIAEQVFLGFGDATTVAYPIVLPASAPAAAEDDTRETATTPSNSNGDDGGVIVAVSPTDVPPSEQPLSDTASASAGAAAGAAADDDDDDNDDDDDQVSDRVLVSAEPSINSAFDENSLPILPSTAAADGASNKPSTSNGTETETPSAQTTTTTAATVTVIHAVLPDLSPKQHRKSASTASDDEPLTRNEATHMLACAYASILREFAASMNLGSGITTADVRGDNGGAGNNILGSDAALQKSDGGVVNPLRKSMGLHELRLPALCFAPSILPRDRTSAEEEENEERARAEALARSKNVWNRVFRVCGTNNDDVDAKMASGNANVAPSLRKARGAGIDAMTGAAGAAGSSSFLAPLTLGPWRHAGQFAPDGPGMTKEALAAGFALLPKAQRDALLNCPNLKVGGSFFLC